MTAIDASGFTKATKKSTVDTGYTSVYNSVYRNTQLHKSLDFSNVGMYAGNGETNAQMRQFHQTRIYVNNFDKMRRHNKLATGTNTYLISANLPESMQYNIGSDWSQPFGDFSSDIGNTLMQFGTSVNDNLKTLLPSGVNRVTTLKVWKGTESLKLSITIPVIDDGYEMNRDATGISTNFQEALEFLGSLILPSQDSITGFYVPPPSPLNLDIIYSKDEKGKTNSFKFDSTYGNIMVQLGGILLINHCIITGLSVNYPNTKTMIRHSYKGIDGKPGETGTDYLLPLLATVTINIETIEAMTSEAYSQMLWLKTNDTMGQGTLDIPATQNAITKAWDSLTGD